MALDDVHASKLKRGNIFTLNPGNPFATNLIQAAQVKQLIESNTNSSKDNSKQSYCIIDVRTADGDFVGGNIIGAKNIPCYKVINHDKIALDENDNEGTESKADTSEENDNNCHNDGEGEDEIASQNDFSNKPQIEQFFLKNINRTINEYCKYDVLIFHCMYSGQRGPKCATLYCSIVKNLIGNYEKKQVKMEQSSKDKDKNKNEEKKDVFGLNNDKMQFAKQFELNQDMYQSLIKQNVYILKDGFHKWVNLYWETNSSLLENFDTKIWTKDNEGEWCHASPE